MAYVDAFLLPVPKKNLALYKKLATKAGKVWLEHGALSYRECVGDDLDSGMGAPFAPKVKAKADEVVIVSWIVFKSKAHRNAVNAKVMKDKRLEAMMDLKTLPFDYKRMAYGGFKDLVAL